MRVTITLLLLLLPALAGAEEPSWSGTWDTRWRDGGARMILEQHGNHVTGSYPAYGGHVEGVTEGRTLTGRWTEGSRSAGLVFVLAPDHRSFMGRFESGEWWTGGRIPAGAEPSDPDRSTPRRALRNFLAAGNRAVAGAPDEIAGAADILDFGEDGATMVPGKKLEAARALFDLMTLTTARLFTLPGLSFDDHVDLNLQQAGTSASLPLTLLRGTDGLWRIRMPSAEVLRSARKALLARSDGRFPASEDYLRRRTPRDAVRSFLAAFADWDDGGRARALGALDLADLSDATRDYEGGLDAQYLNEVLQRVGPIVPQEIPDEAASREPFLLFSHPAGRIVLAPVGEGDATRWRFTTETVRSARDLYAAIEDMPIEADAGPDAMPKSQFFRLRQVIRDNMPALLHRVGQIELWQAFGVAIVLLTSLVASFVLAWPLLVLLRRAIRGREQAAEREFRWPLRLTLGFAVYKLVIPVIGLPEAAGRVSTGASGVLLAASIMWGGWKLSDALASHTLDPDDQRRGALDGIIVSLAVGAFKVVLLTVGFIYIASVLSIPYEGVVAGLGIGGLAVAFASKETLSNVFGAGILVADRPFRRGDWITAGDTQGTVEHVGIRSTRIRTAEDSVIVVPNGKLADATINNLGTRRHRLAKFRLLVPHGIAPEQLDAFVAGLVETASALAAVLPESAQAGISALEPNGVAIELTARLKVSSLADERAAKNALAIGVLRLAQGMDIRLGELPPAAAEPYPASNRRAASPSTCAPTARSASLVSSAQ